MLEPVRQYARERLEESGGAESARRRHAAFFLALAEEAELMLEERDQAAWMERLGKEHPNLRAALSWSLEADPETCLRLAAAVWRFWQMRGHLGEGSRWLRDALARAGERSPPLRAKALRAVGALAWTRGDYRRAEEAFEESLALSRESGDRRTIARALNGLGSVARDRGDYARARTFLEESLALWRRLGNDEGIGLALQNLGNVAFYQGDYPRAVEFYEESLALYREMGERHASAISLNNLGEVARIRGDYARAAELGKESLRVFWEIDDLLAIFQSLISLGRLELARDDNERAVRLFGAAESLRETIGAVLSPTEIADYEQNVAAARSALGEEAFAALWEEGSAMAEGEAVEYALSEQWPAKLSVRESRDSTATENRLTRREEEVAALAARGMTNRQIASELSISEHTAATHVGRVLRKLGLASRAGLAARTAQGPPSATGPRGR
jgi:non-specific serine/threonine protein kinase